MAKTVKELTREELTMLKQHELCERADRGEIDEPGYGELADVDSIISDEEIYNLYSDTSFEDEDFHASEAKHGSELTPSEYAEKFMAKLHEQTRPDPEKTKVYEDKRILRTIRSFVTKQTSEYLKKTNKKEWSTVWYYGVKAGLAGVDFQTALEFVKTEQSHWDMAALETEFGNAYTSVTFDQKNRDWYFHKK